MTDNNPGYHLPPSTQSNYLPPYAFNLRYTNREQGSSTEVNGHGSQDIPTHPANLPQYPHFAYNRHCVNFTPGTSVLTRAAQMNHNENCNRNRAISLPSGYGLPLVPVCIYTIFVYNFCLKIM